MAAVPRQQCRELWLLRAIDPELLQGRILLQTGNESCPPDRRYSIAPQIEIVQSPGVHQHDAGILRASVAQRIAALAQHPGRDTIAQIEALERGVRLNCCQQGRSAVRARQAQLRERVVLAQRLRQDRASR